MGGELPAGAVGAAATLAAGGRVAGYRLERQVGAGGMAVVFHAWDERLRRPVALKIMAPALAADAMFRHRFIRECRAAAAVDDPHIIPVYEAGEADGVLFLAMRLVTGGDVRTLVHQHGPLAPTQAAAVISPVASALDAAHAAGLLHRDVKPANMLLDRRPGRPPHVYLADFGLSKGAPSSPGLTGPGQFLGTPNYTAPEQIQDLPADGRADQYALACAAFELLTGEPPFQHDQGMAVIWAHLREPPPSLNSRRPGLPRAADQVLATALAKSPRDRYPSCGAFAEALRAAFDLSPYHLGPAAQAAAPAGPGQPHPAYAFIPVPAADAGTTYPRSGARPRPVNVYPRPGGAAQAGNGVGSSVIGSAPERPCPTPSAGHTRRRPHSRRRHYIRAAQRETDAAGEEDELAAVVLSQAEVQRSRLIGIEEVGDEAANVRFVKRMGAFRSGGGPSEGNLASVAGYYQSLSPQRLVILGDPGTGKTVLALELLIQLLERRRADSDIPVPVLVSAAACDTSASWDTWLTRHLSQRFGMAVRVMGDLVRRGRILPIMDGLDEMDQPGTRRRANALVAALNSSMRGRERAPVVVTCRRAEYQVLSRNLDRATHVEVLPLSSLQAAAYLSMAFLNERERSSWELVLADLRANPEGLLAAQLATPWRLTLALAVFRAGGQPAELLSGPAAASAESASARQYAQRVDELLLGRYVPAKVCLHGRDRGYSPQKVERWLAALAHGLDRQARHNWSSTDVRLDQWWRPAGPRKLPLAHMAVVAMIALPWAALAAMRNQLGLAVIGATILPLAALAAHPPAPHRLDTDQLSTRLGFLRLLLWFAVGAAAGLALGLTGRFASGLAAGLAFLLALGLTSGLVLGTDDRSPRAIAPRDVIRADRNFGIAAGLAFGLGGGLAGGLAGALPHWLAGRLGVGLLPEPGGLTLGLAEGLALGLAFGLAFGGASSVRYYLGVAAGAARGTRPLAFGSFLDWCCHAGLLRLSGTAYQFRHRQLQDWLMTYPERRCCDGAADHLVTPAAGVAELSAR
jgi:Protein kinase domain/NACHT domain